MAKLIDLDGLKRRAGGATGQLWLIASSDQRVKLSPTLSLSAFRRQSATFAAELQKFVLEETDEIDEIAREALQFKTSVEESNTGSPSYFHSYLWNNNGRLLANLYYYAKDISEFYSGITSEISLQNVPDQSQGPLYATVNNNIITIDEGNSLDALLSEDDLAKTADYLIDEFHEVRKMLVESNIDRRVIEIFDKLSCLIRFTDDAGAIKFGLQLKTVGNTSRLIENELNEIVFVRLSSFLLNSSHFASQYKSWVEFTKNAIIFVSSNDVDEYIQQDTNSLSEVLKSSPETIDQRIPEVFENLGSALTSDSETRKQASYGIIKGFENLCIVAMRYSYEAVTGILRESIATFKSAAAKVIAVGMIALTLKMISVFSGSLGASAELSWIMDNVPRVLKMQEILGKLPG